MQLQHKKKKLYCSLNEIKVQRIKCHLSLRLDGETEKKRNKKKTGFAQQTQSSFTLPSFTDAATSLMFPPLLACNSHENVCYLLILSFSDFVFLTVVPHSKVYWTSQDDQVKETVKVNTHGEEKKASVFTFFFIQSPFCLRVTSCQTMLDDKFPVLTLKTFFSL